MLRVALVLAAAASVLAQVPHSFEAYQPSASRIHVAANALPRMDVQANMEKAKLAAENGIWEFAQINKVDVDLFNASLVSRLDTGVLRKFAYHMENARSMAFFFSHFFIPEGAALYLVSDQETAGPFTFENNWENGKFQTRHIRGNRVEIHYFEEDSVRAAPALHLTVVTTAFREPRDGRSRDAGSCNVHAVCVDPANTCNKQCKTTDRGCSVQCTYIDQDSAKAQWAGTNWRRQISGTVAVARSYASRYCSGAFINNKDGRQLVLTAAHCGPSEADLVLLHFQNPDCTSTDDEAGPTEYAAGNIKTLAVNAEVDNELIEIGETIPDDWEVFLNGYDATDKNTPSHGVVGIHHPSGSNKKISYSDRTLEPAKWVSSKTNNHWKVPGWTVATTEPGSSGSPLFSHATQRIVGQLHGGTAACPALNGYDVYGALWAGYTDGGMQEFLGQPSMDGEELSAARSRRKIVS